jgi:crotonobetainyl-CoA:carnitine CoA-transferase CaiB-like acyl-CoA transferase
LFADADCGDGSKQKVLRQPVKFSAYDNAPLRAAPTVGQHQGESFD